MSSNQNTNINVFTQRTGAIFWYLRNSQFGTFVLAANRHIYRYSEFKRILSNPRLFKLINNIKLAAGFAFTQFHRIPWCHFITGVGNQNSRNGKMVNKIVLMLALAFSLNSFASIESEVEAERFKRNGDILVDTWSGLSWLDNNNTKELGMDFDTATTYCGNLSLNGIKNWRLPTYQELSNASKQRKFFRNYYNEYASFWGEITQNKCTYLRNSEHFAVVFKRNEKRCTEDRSKYLVRCVSGDKHPDLISIIKKGRFNKLQNKYAALFEICRKQNTIQGYVKFITNHPDSTYIGEAKNLLYDLYEHKYKLLNNTISDYHHFNKDYKKAPQVKKSIVNIFTLIKKENNISGYEWFLANYPKSSQISEAIKSIHKLAFAKAKEINFISAYNTFIITYPTAKEVKHAQGLAYQLETEKYTDFGTFGNFFEKEAKMEKSARKLLIKAKQIERKSKDYRGDATLGYILITNRMYDLLQEKFDDSDATLRHLESQEFKDFIEEFKSAIRTVNKRLDNIARYSQEIINVAKQGFADAKADRAMAAYKLEEHEEWEKFMHFRDKGYN